MSTIDYGQRAQMAAEEHLAACEAALYADDYYAAEEPDEDEEIPDWPEDMAGPYDGCTTCQVREILHAAWPHAIKAALEPVAEWAAVNEIADVPLDWAGLGGILRAAGHGEPLPAAVPA